MKRIYVTKQNFSSLEGNRKELIYLGVDGKNDEYLRKIR